MLGGEKIACFIQAQVFGKSWLRLKLLKYGSFMSGIADSTHASSDCVYGIDYLCMWGNPFQKFIPILKKCFFIMFMVLLPESLLSPSSLSLDSSLDSHESTQLLMLISMKNKPTSFKIYFKVSFNYW